MPIDPQQLHRRALHIGSSDSAAIVGLSPYRSAYDVWLEKRGLVEPTPENEAIAIGNMVEEPLLDWCAAEIGRPIQKNVERVHAGGILAANHDALVLDRPEGLEAKTGGIVSLRVSEEWGEAGTDQIPTHYLIQCQHQMIVSGLSLVWVPALLAGRGRVLFKVERDDELCQAIESKCTSFWMDNVVAAVPPDVAKSRPSLDVVKRVRREPGAVAQIPYEVVRDYLEAKERLKDAEAACEFSQALLLAALGEAEAGDSPLGRVTYFEQRRKSFDHKRLLQEHPEFANYHTESAYRVLRHLKAKKED